MTLPEFRKDGWLPEGHHDASWEEIMDRFGGAPGSRRERVMRGMLEWRDEVREKGISGLLILDGSFISDRENPGDFDALLVYGDEVQELLENDVEAERLLDYSSCKDRGFDLLRFSASLVRDQPEWAYLGVWDLDKETGKPKGVLEVAL